MAAAASSVERETSASHDAGRQEQRSRAIPAAIRRAVYERDAGQCCYVDPQTGRRCEARRRLEFHHRLPFARGGPHSVDNVCLACRTHNADAARRDFGAAHIEAAVAARRLAVGASSLPRGELLGGGAPWNVWLTRGVPVCGGVAWVGARVVAFGGNGALRFDGWRG